MKLRTIIVGTYFLAAVCGCDNGSRSSLWDRFNELGREKAALEQQVQELHRKNNELSGQVRTLSDLAPEIRLAALGDIKQIKIGRRSGLFDKDKDGAKEKHLPVVEKTETSIKVKVSSIPHPMEEKHYIEWIEVVADGKIYRKHLKPYDNPEAEFKIHADNIVARAYCNIHGLWKGE